MLLKNYLVFIPGIILAFVLYTLSQGFNNIIGIELLGYEKSPISTAMIAIILGIILMSWCSLFSIFLIIQGAWPVSIFLGVEYLVIF